MLVQQKLSSVVEGMEIYDRDGAQVGTVKAFRMGEGTVKTTQTDIVTISEALEPIIGNKELPTILYSRLYDEGFVVVARGFLRSDAVIFPSQIDQFGDGALHLNVPEDDLFKL
ncbi:MAG: hypothetical protein Phog2KO_48510 [Phototrophicaceae bacterium]